MGANNSMLYVHAHLTFSLVSKVATLQRNGRLQKSAQHDRCHRSNVVLNKSRVSTCEQTMQNSMLNRVVGMAVLPDLRKSFGTLQAKDQIALESRSTRDPFCHRSRKCAQTIKALQVATCDANLESLAFERRQMLH